MSLQPSLLFILQLLVLRVAAWDCSSLLSFNYPNTTITGATHITAGTNFTASAEPTCFLPTYVNSVDVCRVAGVVNTSSTSSVAFEVWLPDTWYGRVLTAGNGGLGGCIGYPFLDHGSAHHFATIATNNGHDGSLVADPFLLPARIESVTDFSHRAVHVASKIGKRITATYYGAEPHHSYYNGCSAGGRQGISVASRFPEDFDGIIVGSPGVDWNRFMGASGIWASYVAANTSSAIPLPLWNTTITQEVLRQCDGLDGKVDGIITDPSSCSWNPETLLCGPGSDGSNCLTQDQIDGLKKLYQPILGSNGEVIVSPYDPGAEGDVSIPIPMGGTFPLPTLIWYNYAIYGDPARSVVGFSPADLEYADTVDPVGISTWSDSVDGFGKFMDKGGKVITFHGTRDPVIPSGQSKRFHDLLSSNIKQLHNRYRRNGSPKCDLDDSYRLFMIPGMGHCVGGPGAWRFSQGAVDGIATTTVNQTDHDVLLSLVAWVEGGQAPETLIGTDDAGQERKHCLWPSQKSVWNGSAWDCVPA